MKTQQKGFTLIELIIVIVVLGILAVTAAPQFFNFSTDARVSAVKGLQGAVNGAKDIVYGKAAIAGVETKATDNVDGVDVVYGYPAASDTGIMAALNVSNNDFSSEQASADVGDVKTGDLVIFPADKAVTANINPDTKCYVIYRAAADASTPPVVEAVIDGC